MTARQDIQLICDMRCVVEWGFSGKNFGLLNAWLWVMMVKQKCIIPYLTHCWRVIHPDAKQIYSHMLWNIHDTSRFKQCFVLFFFIKTKKCSMHLVMLRKLQNISSEANLLWQETDHCNALTPKTPSTHPTVVLIHHRVAVANPSWLQGERCCTH